MLQKGLATMGVGQDGNPRKVPRFFERKFWEWQAGERRTQKEFAEYLEVEPATLSHWMNGIRKPDYESCLHLADRLGNEIFDVCEYLRPDPELKSLVAQWDGLSKATREKILQDAGVEAVSEIEEGSETKSVD